MANTALAVGHQFPDLRENLFPLGKINDAKGVECGRLAARSRDVAPLCLNSDGALSAFLQRLFRSPRKGPKLRPPSADGGVEGLPLPLDVGPSDFPISELRVINLDAGVIAGYARVDTATFRLAVRWRTCHIAPATIASEIFVYGRAFFVQIIAFIHEPNGVGIELAIQRLQGARPGKEPGLITFECRPITFQRVPRFRRKLTNPRRELDRLQVFRVACYLRSPGTEKVRGGQPARPP